MMKNIFLSLLGVLFMSTFPSQSACQAIFLEADEQCFGGEITGKGIYPGVYYEHAIPLQLVENLSVTLGVSSLFMKQDDSNLDLAFPTIYMTITKYKAFGESMWTYWEFGISRYHRKKGGGNFPAWGAGFCLAPGNGLYFCKLGLTSVMLLPNVHASIGVRF